MTLILPQISGTYDWFRLVEGVDSCLQQLRANDVPESAISPVLEGLFAVDGWVGDVLNGGHSQYVGNKGEHVVPNLSRALVTVKACGMQGWVRILDRVIDWVRKAPDQAARMTGFSGGVSEELQALDREFAATWQRDEAAFVAAFMSLPIVRLVPQQALGEAVRAEAQRLIATDPNLRWQLARKVTLACHTFLADAAAVALALACQKADLVLRATAEPLPLGPERDVTFSMMLVQQGLPGIPAIWQVLDRTGLCLQTEVPPERGGVLAEVTWAEVRMAQDMARKLRLPEMVGLSWRQTKRAFHLRWARMKVFPGPFWARSQGGVNIGAADWAVMCSPSGVEFHDTLTKESQRLNPRQLTAMIEEAGL